LLALLVVAPAVASPLVVQFDQTGTSIRWHGDEENGYSVEESFDLVQWHPVLEATGLRGEGRELDFSVPVSGSRGFFRVVSYPVAEAPVFESSKPDFEVDQSELSSGFFLPVVSDPQGGISVLHAVVGDGVSVELTSEVFTLSAPSGFTGVIPVVLIAISDSGAASRLAFNVTVTDFPLFDACSVPILGDNPLRAVAESGEEGFGLVGETGKLWPKGTTLRVFFTTPDFRWEGSMALGPANAVGAVKLTAPPMGTTHSIRDVIMDCAAEWTRFANINFEVVAGPFASVADQIAGSDIRIAINAADGSWSFVGTDARGETTSMNLGFSPTTAPWRVQSHVLHEFGHALGFHHEHQHPENGIQWDVEPVEQDYILNEEERARMRCGVLDSRRFTRFRFQTIYK